MLEQIRRFGETIRRLTDESIEEIISPAYLREFMECYDLREHVQGVIDLTERTGNEAGFYVYKELGQDVFAFSDVIEGGKNHIAVDFFEYSKGQDRLENSYLFLFCHTHPGRISTPSHMMKSGDNVWGTDHHNTPLLHSRLSYSFQGSCPPNRLLGLVVAVPPKYKGYTSTLFVNDSSFGTIYPYPPNLVGVSGALEAEQFYKERGNQLVALYFENGRFHKITPEMNLEPLRNEHFEPFDFHGRATLHLI